MYKKSLQALLMAIALLNVHMGATGANIVHSATPSLAEPQVEHAAYTQIGEKNMFTKIVQNLFTTTLHMATKIGDVDKVRSLLAKGHDVNGLDKNGITPLFWAAFVEDLEVARILVEHGAEIDFKGPTGATPLLNALLRGNEDLALWLLERGANPLTVDNGGNSLLHLASLHGMDDIVAILLERGADVNALNARGFSPLSTYLVVPLQKSPGTVSPSFIFRLLEAGANYDPVPVTEKTLMDICLEMANSYALDRELTALIARTKNAKLRAYAQEMLERSQKLPVRDIVDIRSELRRIKQDAGQDAGQERVQSSVLGTIVRGKYDSWEAEPVAIPLYNNEKHAVYYSFDPEKDPSFLADADKAMAAFLKLDDAFRLSLSARASEWAKSNLSGWIEIDYKAESTSDWLGVRDKNLDGVWLTAFVKGEKKAEDVWRMVGNISEIYLERNTADGLIYVVVLWNCLWDEEHGFQLVFREGASLTRMSDGDGELTD